MPVLDITEAQVISLLREMPAPERERLFALSAAPLEEKQAAVLPNKPRPMFGRGKNDIAFIADDFDAPLDDFKDYMP